MDCKSREERALRLARAVKLVQAGDVNAYEEIYAVCDGALRAFTSRRYGHLGGDFADEVVIRTHEYAFSHLNNYSSDRGASFQTWLIWLSRSFACHVAREWYSPRSVRYNQAEHEPWAVTDTGPVDAYEEKRLSRVLAEETESLPVSERLCIALHDKCGQTFAETAVAVGTTLRRVRYRRERALAVLKRRLQERGVRPVAIDTTSAPIWSDRDNTDPGDDYTSSVTAVLPDGPVTPACAAACDPEEEEGE